MKKILFFMSILAIITVPSEAIAILWVFFTSIWICCFLLRALRQRGLGYARSGESYPMKRKKLPWAWVRHGLISIMWCAEIRPEFRPDWNTKSVVWGRRIKYGFTILPRDWWFHVWLPKWCKGRGYYISIGLWLFSVHRGY